MNQRKPRRAAALVAALVALLVVVLTAAALMQSMMVVHRQSRLVEHELQAQWLAEAAVSRAAARLATDADYRGESWRTDVGSEPAVEHGLAEIAVEPIAEQPKLRKIVVHAHFPDHEWRRASASRELTTTLQPSSANTKDAP